MNYTVKSQTGWTIKAATREEAIRQAVEHQRQWAEVGQTVGYVIVYRDGSIVSKA